MRSTLAPLPLAGARARVGRGPARGAAGQGGPGGGEARAALEEPQHALLLPDVDQRGADGAAHAAGLRSGVRGVRDASIAAAGRCTEQERRARLEQDLHALQRRHACLC